MAGDAGLVWLLLAPLPQAVNVSESENTTRADRSRFFKHFSSDSAADCSYRRNLLFQGCSNCTRLSSFATPNRWPKNHPIVTIQGLVKVQRFLAGARVPAAI